MAAAPAPQERIAAAMERQADVAERGYRLSRMMTWFGIAAALAGLLLWLALTACIVYRVRQLTGGDLGKTIDRLVDRAGGVADPD